eukprot:5808806-Ditylum_brightwellii.AAC.1
MLGAEKQCRKAKAGHLWSVKLVQAARTAHYWKTCKFDWFNNREASKILLHLDKKLDIQYENLDANTSASKLTTAQKELKEIQKNAAEIRDNYSEEMAQEQTKAQNTDITTIIKNIRHREEVKSSFRLIKPITRGSQGRAVSLLKVEAPVQSSAVYLTTMSKLGYKSDLRIIDNKGKVIARLLSRNRLHLNKALETPCA